MENIKHVSGNDCIVNSYVLIHSFIKNHLMDSVFFTSVSLTHFYLRHIILKQTSDTISFHQ